jgi:serine/threonine protein kinase
MDVDGTENRRSVGDGRFDLVERLGNGAMGTVWRAYDTSLHREVALKAVRAPADIPADDAATLRARALREAQALARLRNPHVSAVYQIVDDDPFPWIVMELVPGRPLASILADGTMSPSAAAAIGRDVADALIAAHGAGVLHRDVKPANVLVRPDGEAVLVDFGIAAVEGSATVTGTGSFIGTLEYIAPERTQGHPPDPASDLWSFGVLLYVAVEGRSPFRRDNHWATLAAIVNDPHPQPRQAGRLTDLIDALLAKDPAARPDGPTVLARLASIAETGSRPPATPSSPAPPQPGDPGADPSPHTTATPAPAPRRGRRRQLVIAAVIAALLAGGGAAVALTLNGSDGAPESQPPTGTRSSPPAPPALPAGYELRTHSDGFEVAVPVGWKEARDGNGFPVYESPDGTARLVVRPLRGNTDQPMTEQQESAAETRDSSSYPGYRQITMASGTFGGGLSATWEYAFRTAEGPRHIKDVRWRVGPNSYNLWIAAPDGPAWPQYAAQLDIALHHFRDTRTQ